MSLLFYMKLIRKYNLYVIDEAIIKYGIEIVIELG